MKYLVFLLLLPLTLHASDVPLKITDRIKAQAVLTPDLMSASLSVSYSSSEFSKASAQMEKIASILKAHSDTCDYNSYSVSPVYTYDNREKNSYHTKGLSVSLADFRL
jgi:hypothetical protein